VRIELATEIPIVDIDVIIRSEVGVSYKVNESMNERGY
jgi:hypothetical protein